MTFASYQTFKCHHNTVLNAFCIYRLIYEKNENKALCSQTVVNQDTQSNQMIQCSYVLYMLVSMIFSVNSKYR